MDAVELYTTLGRIHEAAREHEQVSLNISRCKYHIYIYLDAYRYLYIDVHIIYKYAWTRSSYTPRWAEFTRQCKSTSR